MTFIFPGNGTQQNTSTPSDVKFVAEPDKSLSSCEGPAVEDSTPSTSYGQGAIPWSNMELDWNFVDEGIDSDGLSWMTETSDIEKLAKKAALLQPSRNEQQVLKHINYKESRMSEALERFHGRLKNLDISTLTELKFLVVYMSTNSQICVHRQQSQNTIPVICRQLNTIAVFIGWFVTNGPIFDFNQCKRMVAERVALRGDKFDLPKTICGILRRNSHVTEADVKILGRLFDKPTYNTAAALDHLDPRKSPYDYMPLFLDRVYEWFESEYANFMRRQQYRNA